MSLLSHLLLSTELDLNPVTNGAWPNISHQSSLLEPLNQLERDWPQGQSFQLVEWSEQLRPVTSVWLGTIRHGCKSGSALSSGCKRKLFGTVSPLGSVFNV